MFSKVHIHLQLYIFCYIFFSLCYHAALDTFTLSLAKGRLVLLEYTFSKPHMAFPNSYFPFVIDCSFVRFLPTELQAVALFLQYPLPLLNQLFISPPNRHNVAVQVVQSQRIYITSIPA